jgi:hypothetical protein
MSSYKFNEYIDFIKKHFDKEYDENKCNNKYINNKYINNKLNKKIKNIKGNDIDISIKIGKNINLIFELDVNGMIKYDNIEILYEENNVKINCYQNWFISINYKDVYKINLSINDYEIINLCDNIIENEEYRGKGIGTKGMSFLLNFFKKAKYIKLQGKLSTIDDIERLKNFIKKMVLIFMKMISNIYFVKNLKKLMKY